MFILSLLIQLPCATYIPHLNTRDVKGEYSLKGSGEHQQELAPEEYGRYLEYVGEYLAERTGAHIKNAVPAEERRIGRRGRETGGGTDRRTGLPETMEDSFKFFIDYDKNNWPFVIVEDDILDGVPKDQWVKTVKDNLRRKFPKGVSLGRNTVKINNQSRSEMTFSNYMRRLFKSDPQIYSDKLRAVNNAGEILQATRNWVNEVLLHPRKDAMIDFARGEVQLRVGGRDYTAQVIVGNKGGGDLLLYDIIGLKPTTIRERI